MRFKNNYVEPVSETGNWNVAFDYTKFKISKLLVEMDEYQTIATFGTSELFEEFFIVDDSIKIKARLLAIDRLLKSLKMIIENTKFAVKKREDKILLKQFYRRLIRIEKELFPHIKKEKTEGGVKKTVINERVFDDTLMFLTNIKTEINTPLNNADLIFNSTEEFNPDKFKADIMRKMGETP